MWADNETTIDLLGFDYLVDTLEVVVTNKRLLPVTVGVLGDWGSGKTSLLQMLQDRLDRRDESVVVSFSPWRYEAFEDVKTALMAAILVKLDERIRASDDAAESIKLLRRLGEKVRRLMAGPRAMARTMAPTVGTLAAPQIGLPPEVGSAVATAALAGIDAVTQPQEDGEKERERNEPLTFESVADFRDEFATLVAGIEGLQEVIVLVDDLDRCLPETIVDVFEAIRLFLHVPATAYVVAAHREIVQAAIEGRYPVNQRGDASLGKDYLEKILQVEVNVPPLAEPEAETFLNLLFAEFRLSHDEQLSRIREAARRRRGEAEFAVAMNYGIAAEALGDVPPDLQADFEIANRIAPTLSRGLRGNPRQLKRFLNTLVLRLETARRRNVTLEPAILAKLMVLEQQSLPQFEQLFRWQLAQDGHPEQLAVAERMAAADGELPGDAPSELRTWVGSPVVGQWLRLEPPLAGIALGQYFFFSRDRLSPAAPASRLPAQLQALLGRLQLTPPAQRRTAITEATALTVEEFGPLHAALLDRAAAARASGAGQPEPCPGPHPDASCRVARRCGHGRGSRRPRRGAAAQIPPCLGPRRRPGANRPGQSGQRHPHHPAAGPRRCGADDRRLLHLAAGPDRPRGPAH